MKYLYMILRLFKCPHKWKTLAKELLTVTNNYTGNKSDDGYVVTQQCTRCGKMHIFNHRV